MTVGTPRPQAKLIRNWAFRQEQKCEKCEKQHIAHEPNEPLCFKCKQKAAKDTE